MGILKTKGKNKLVLFMKKRAKPIYLLFIIIPLAYTLLWRNQTLELSDNAKHPDYLSFSVRSTHPAQLSLVENKREIISWNINSKGYKNLEFVGQLNSNAGINFKANNLKSNDTLSFLGINLYSNNKLFSLSNTIKQYISITNAKLSEKDGVLMILVEKSGSPVTISLKPPKEWEGKEPFSTKKIIIVLVFLFTFLLILVVNPSTKYFILSLVLAVFVLTISYFADNHTVGNVTITTTSKIKNTEIFYSQTPFFSATKKYSSERVTDAFSQPINLETERYLRFDVGDSLLSIKQIKIKVSSGIFSKSYNLSQLSQNKLILNDLALVGNTYYVTGNDPYIKMTSTYFINNLEFLLFFEHNIFLFITLLVFLIVIIINRLLDKNLNKLKLKPAYLTFVLIPIVYYQINQHWVKKNAPAKADYFYFSAQTSHPAIFTLMNGGDSVTSWLINSPGFKYFQFKGHFNVNENFFLKITNLSNNDTIALLSINLFHDNKTYSLFEKNHTACKINNAGYSQETDGLNIIVKKTYVPVIISLLPSNLLKNTNQEHTSKAIVVLILCFAFLVVLIFSPNQRFIIVSVLVTSVMMIMFFWLSNDIQSQLVLSTSSPAKRVDFFYNNIPTFVPNKTYLDITSRNVFKLQILPNEFQFYRCDIGEDKEKINDLMISTKIGLLSNNWNYRTISPEKILLNDLIKCGNAYRVCGDDPFIALSSAHQINKLRSIVLIRQNLFFYVSILLLLLIIVSNKYLKKDKIPNFFLVVFFLTFIFTSLFFHLFNSENKVLISENRCTNPLPTFQIDSSNVFTKEIDNYILDQLPGRKNIIRMNNLVQYSVFKQLVNNQVIHFGEDGWMFYIAGPAKENYENHQPLTTAELNKIKNVLVARNDWLKKRNIHFYMVFPPMPQTVFEEYVGPRMRRHYKQSKSEQLLEYLKLNTNLDIIDVYTPLMKIKNKGLMNPYYINNCHWNYLGGYAAYCSMINYIKKDFPNIGEPLNSKDFKWEVTEDYKPDLLQLLDIDKFFTFQQYSPSFYESTITDTIYPTYLDLWTPAPPACVITNKNNNPTMLMYGDSYAESILKFLFRNFSKTYFIWTPLFQPTVIEKEKPDMVIQEMVEGSIESILMKNKPFPELKDSTNKPPN